MARGTVPVARLSDDALIARVRTLTERERGATVDLIASLAEFDARSLYLGQGCSSMFSYCTEVLHLSEHAAYGRIAAARAARRFPVILDLLRDGSITLTTVTLLSPHLREGNYRELLETACHKSKREVELLAAAIRPRPSISSSIRKLPTPGIIHELRRAAVHLSDARLWFGDGFDVDADSHAPDTRPTNIIGVSAGETSAPRSGVEHSRAGGGVATAGTVAPGSAGTESWTSGVRTRDGVAAPRNERDGEDAPRGLQTAGDSNGSGHREADGAALRIPGASVSSSVPDTAKVTPLSADRYRVQFTASQQMYERLRRAQDLLRHSIPDGDPAAIFDRALALLIEQVERTKLAATHRPRKTASRTPAKPRSRRVPAAVRRQVWNRDGGRCAFVGTHGRCTERGFLEFHHVVPFGAGGAATAENIQLRCRAHNAHEAREYYGPEHSRPRRRDAPADRQRAPSGTPAEKLPKKKPPPT